MTLEWVVATAATLIAVVAGLYTIFNNADKRSGDTFTKISGISALAGAGWSVSFSSDDTYLAVAHQTTPFITIYKTTLINPRTLISPALNTIPLGYHDLGYALESGIEDDEIEMVSIFR